MWPGRICLVSSGLHWGILIINIVYFQEGLMGCLQRKFPEYFGITVDSSNRDEKQEA